ncbi:hypothetical protein WMY93_029817 [Mugilogobius chulae]|uniref:Reverse transcriptase domain-containing protein n=1 Tax=Mugilogobius chulae TaxID=88201 RepID=A0AAW0MSU5_9GOBI
MEFHKRRKYFPFINAVNELSPSIKTVRVWNFPLGARGKWHLLNTNLLRTLGLPDSKSLSLAKTFSLKALFGTIAEDEIGELGRELWRRYTERGPMWKLSVIRREGRDLAVVFIDLAKAFDTVSHQLIRASLERRAVDGGIVRLIEDLYTGCHSRVKTKDGQTEPFAIKLGVKQGDPLSPTLFNLSLDPLLYALDKMGKGVEFGEDSTVTSLAYADDLVLLSDGWDGMARNLAIVEAFSRLKCHLNNCGGWELGGQPIRQVGHGEHVKYLGVLFEPTKGVCSPDALVALNGILNKKLELLRVYALPRLLYVLDYAEVKTTVLMEADRRIRKLVKEWLHLDHFTCDGLLYARFKDGGLSILKLEMVHFVGFPMGARGKWHPGNGFPLELLGLSGTEISQKAETFSKLALTGTVRLCRLYRTLTVNPLDREGGAIGADSSALTTANQSAAFAYVRLLTVGQSCDVTTLLHKTTEKKKFEPACHLYMLDVNMSNQNSRSCPELLREAVLLIAEALRRTPTAEQQQLAPSIQQPARAQTPQQPHQTPRRHPVQAEVSRLFAPYSATNRRGGQNANASARTYTHSFFCLADQSLSMVPSIDLKALLQASGLGEQRVTFSGSGDSS